MATPIIMPRPEQSVESCVLSKWHKKVGDKVNVGDDLFSYETNKSSFDEASEVEGEMLATYYEEGEDVPCLKIVCVIGQKGETHSLNKQEK